MCGERKRGTKGGGGKKKGGGKESPNIRLGKNHIRRIWTELRITRNVL